MRAFGPSPMLHYSWSEHQWRHCIQSATISQIVPLCFRSSYRDLQELSKYCALGRVDVIMLLINGVYGTPY